MVDLLSIKTRKYRGLGALCFVFALSVSLSSIGMTEDSNGDEVITLDEIVVSATRTPAGLDDVPASTSIVSERQIRSSTAVDLGHLLGTTNILSISDYGPGGISMASIRGSSHEQVLVLVDGERLNDGRSGGADLDNIPVTYARRIEVVRGGHSAMYGADAVGGIVNIITKQPNGSNVRAWSALGSYDYVSWGAEASRQIKAVSGLISFSQTDTEADFPFEDKYGRELVRENAGFMKRSVFGRLKWDISSSMSLRLSGDHYYSDKGDPGPIGQFSPEATKRDKSSGLKADLEQNLAEGISYKLSVYQRGSSLRYLNPQGPYPADDTHKTDATGAEFQAHFLQDTSIPLVWGVYLRDDDITSTALGDQSRRTYSAYVQQELSRDLDDNRLHLDRVAVFPAVRWDRYSDFEAGVSPRIGFLASFGRYPSATIKANVGKSYRAPTMNELYWPSDAFAFGNPDLKPERSTNMDAGLHFQLSEPPALSGLSTVRCGVTYFWNSFRDRIQWNPGAGGKWSPQNLSEAHSSGLELEAQVQASLWKVPDLVSMGVNYTFLEAEDALGRQLIYRPRHSAGYIVRVGTGSLWGQLQGLYQSRRYYTVQNTKWLEPLMKHDVQLGLERRLWGIAKLGFIIEIRNVFNTKYQFMADYPLPGREWIIKTSVGMEGE